MPLIILRERRTNLYNLEPSREIVDGQQRIRTVLSYISLNLIENPKKEDGFTVQYNHNPDLAGKSFSELPEEIRQRILDYEFSVHILPASIDDREVLQIFARLNATGSKLNDQELRNSEYFWRL